MADLFALEMCQVRRQLRHALAIDLLYCVCRQVLLHMTADV